MHQKNACDGFKTEQKILGITHKTSANNVLEIWMICRDLNFDNTVVTYTYMYSIYIYIYIYTNTSGNLYEFALAKERFLSILPAHSFYTFF